MYQEDFHLSHYQQFPPKLPPQHTDNGQSLQFPPIRKVDLRRWPLNSGTTFDQPITVGNLGSTSLADVIWYIAGRFCELEEIVDFVCFPCVAAAILGKIADNVINGSLSIFIKCLPHTQCSFTPSKFPTFFMNVKIETPFGSLCPSPFQ